MAENKKSFILYVDQIHLFEGLDDDEAGRLIKHIFKYVNDLNPEFEDKITRIAFEPIKQQLKRDLIRWGEKKVVRSESGRLGGIKSGETRRKQKEANEANASITKQTEANEAVNVNVNVIYIADFNLFRKNYPGKKTGLETEFKNFQKHKDWKEVLPSLNEIILKQIKNREGRKWNPEWKNLKTWLHNRCWEEEVELPPEKLVVTKAMSNGEYFNLMNE